MGDFGKASLQFAKDPLKSLLSGVGILAPGGVLAEYPLKSVKCPIQTLFPEGDILAPEGTFR